MPSPIAHGAMGYAVYWALRGRRDEDGARRRGPVPVSLAVTLGVSLLPDVDSVVGIALGDLGRFHNNVTHSVIVGLGVACLVGALAARRRRSSGVSWFVLSLAAYGSHVLLDSLTTGRGVMAFWPLSSQRYLSPVTMFYGLRWSDGLLSLRHMVTLVSELAFVLLVALVTGFRPFPHRRARAVSGGIKSVRATRPES